MQIQEKAPWVVGSVSTCMRLHNRRVEGLELYGYERKSYFLLLVKNVVKFLEMWLSTIDCAVVEGFVVKHEVEYKGISVI